MAPALSDILRLTSSLLILMLLTFCMGATNSEAQVGGLANDEVEALLEIATQLGKKGWNRKGCDDNVTVLPQKPYADNIVVCDCSFPGGVCHVVAIYLKGQDLDGSLPKAIQKLPHLKQLDLWANYLSGNIPPEWAVTKLEFLSLGVNRLSGKIPRYLGKITTLRYLSIENNMFSGTVPPELGELVNLENLTLSANNLSGELPSTLANLTRLKALRLSRNNFTGRIPEFIQSWKQLDALEIEAGGFTGPIPSNISLLTSLTELRISNLLGNGSEIPNLDRIAGIKKLMLSNCNLSGNFPEYLTRKSQLKILDLSFNRLSGPLPHSFEGLHVVQKMYLTWNNFTGPMPDWIDTRDSRNSIDLSYNNFTSEPKILAVTLNPFKSTWGWNYSKPVECLNAGILNKDIRFYISPRTRQKVMQQQPVSHELSGVAPSTSRISILRGTRCSAPSTSGKKSNLIPIFTT